LADPAKLATKENISAAAEEVKGISKPSEAKNVPEDVEAFRKAFEKLLKNPSASANDRSPALNRSSVAG